MVCGCIYSVFVGWRDVALERTRNKRAMQEFKKNVGANLVNDAIPRKDQFALCHKITLTLNEWLLDITDWLINLLIESVTFWLTNWLTRQLIDQSIGWVILWILTFCVISHGFSACSKLPFLATTSGPLRVIAGAQSTAWSQCTSGMFRGLEELHAGDPSRQVLRHGVAKTGMNGSLKSDIDVHRPFKNPHRLKYTRARWSTDNKGRLFYTTWY